jgi:hypothetical protein
VSEAFNGYRYRPSLGFLLVCLVYIAGVTFIVWGFLQPDLDRVWFLKHELRIGVRGELSAEDIDVLLRSMAAHPDLCEDLTDGAPIAIISAQTSGFLETATAYLLREPDTAASRVTLCCQGPPEAWPLQIRVRTFDREGERLLGKLTFEQAGTHGLELAATHLPELIEIRCGGTGEDPLATDGVLATVNVQVIFGDER